MRIIHLILLGAFATAGCVSKSTARLREKEAFLKGQQEMLSSQQRDQQPMVIFRGLIRQPRVPWKEGLTLAQGILMAQYNGATDPGIIRVIRQGQVYRIDVKLLLRGENDPLLEPGDIVELLP